jgi:hypothetical protein
MPKVTITFDLPEEQSEFDCAINAGNFKNAIWNFEQQLRSWYKYHHHFKTADDAIQGIRNYFYQCLNEHNVSTD